MPMLRNHHQRKKIAGFRWMLQSVVGALLLGLSFAKADAFSELESAVEAGRLDQVAELLERIGQSQSALPPPLLDALTAARSVPPGMEDMVGAFDALTLEAEASFESGNLQQGLVDQEGVVMFASDVIGPTHLLTADAQFRLFQKLLAAGIQPYAEAMIDAAYGIYAEQLGPAHPSTVQLLAQSHWVYLMKGDIETASDILDIAQSQMQAALPPGHTFNQLIAEDQIKILNQTGRSEGAAAAQQALCATLANAVSVWHPRHLACLDYLAIIEMDRGALTAAGEHLRLGITLATESAGATSARALNMTLRQADVLRKTGNADAAKTMLSPSTRRHPCWLGNGACGQKPYLVDTLIDLAAFDEALAILTEVEPSARQIWMNNPQNLYTLVGKRGDLLQRLGQYNDAEVAFLEVLAGMQAVVGESDPMVIAFMNNLGNLYETMGLYDQAEPLMKRALALVEGVRGADGPEAARQSNNLALLYESQGSFREAEPLYKKSILVLQGLFGEDHLETIAMKNNLAFLYFMMNQYDQAAPAFKDVLTRWTRTLGEDHPFRLKALNNLGRVQLKSGALVEAEQTLLLALTLRQGKLGADHPDVIRSLIDLGGAYLLQDRLDEAMAMLKDALAKAEAVLGEQHPYTFEALNGLSDVYVAQNRLTAGVELKRQGFLRRSAFLDRMLWVTGENAREGYMRLHRPEFMSYLQLLAQVGGPDSARLGLEASMHRKGLLLKITSEIQQIGRMTQNPALASLANELRVARESLAKLTLSGPTAETAGRHPEALYALEQAVNELQGELGRASAQYRTSIAKISVEALEAEIDEGKALVDFQSYSTEDGPHYLASVVARIDGELEYALVNYEDAAEVDELIGEYRETIQDPAADEIDFLEVGQMAYEAIWEPIANVTSGIEYVYLIPDGLLNILPFAALVDFDDAYLVETLDFHFLTSGRDLLPSFLSLSEGPYMIVAGPDYDAAEVADPEEYQQAAASRAAQGDTLRGAGSGLRGLSFLPLPGAQKEGEIILEQVDAQNEARSVFSQGAAEEQVISELTEIPEILHIATHGFFLKADENLKKRLLKLQRGADLQVPPPGDNPLLRAGLAFAGINKNAQFLGDIDTRNDGVLTALEVLDLKLSGTKLVVLSACETGLGEIHEGEGVYGLRRAFQEAGVSEVVNSLWEVSDAGTQALMIEFYQRILTGMPARQALRESQLALKASPLWGQPYIWSAFMMVGSYESAGIAET
jgi:CHAT domain-containing protein